MRHRGRLLTSLLIITLSIVPVKAQLNAVEVIVDSATVKPSINGEWQQFEWDDAAEYKLNVGSSGILNRPYVRFEHDNDTLYGLVDVPSDDGGYYVNSNSKIQWGQVVLVFYHGARFDFHNTTQDFTAFQISTNQTHLAYTRVVCRCSDQYARMVSSHSTAALSVSSTIHYGMKHSVWEFAIRIYPYVTNESLNSTPNPKVGFTIAVVDSFGHSFLLANSDQSSEMSFISTVAQGVPIQNAQAVKFVLEH